MDKLKPCPFCGGEAKFETNALVQRGDTSGWLFGITCSHCGVRAVKTNYKYEVAFGECGYIATVVDERPLAIEAWNRRVKDGKKAD